MSEQNKKRGLGRGLSALFGDAKPSDIKEGNLPSAQKALIGDLDRNKYQPRIKFDQEKLQELSKSIKKNGVIQPIAVRRKRENPDKFEIIAGERRWLAAQNAGLHEVPINILELTDSETLEVAIVENVQREDLNSIEEAKGYKRLIEEFRYDQEKVSHLMSKSRSHISNTLRLLSLPEDVVAMLEEGLITAGQARPLIGLSDPSSIAEAIVAKKMSARQVEKFVKQEKNLVKNPHSVDANIQNIEKKLEEILGLKTTINNKKNNSGKVIIEYKNLNQFDMIKKLLSSS
ncbi:ParB/RepB/Spo0J family partition protein [Pelagibacteraceae bacterium]|jgi:ParB family chromosome partitioning protein|nr:ParB/RepB/Spo0J family partition protein [Pelagibacteraceae bacterium]